MAGGGGLGVRGGGSHSLPLVLQTSADVTSPATAGRLTRSSGSGEFIFPVDQGIKTFGLSERLKDKTNKERLDS